MFSDLQVLFQTRRLDAQALAITPFRSGGGEGVEFALKGVFNLFYCLTKF